MAGKFCCLTLQATSFGIHSQLVVVKRWFSFADDMTNLDPGWNPNLMQPRVNRGEAIFVSVLRSCDKCLRANLRCAISPGIFGRIFTIVDYITCIRMRNWPDYSQRLNLHSFMLYFQGYVGVFVASVYYYIRNQFLFCCRNAGKMEHILTYF